MCVELIAMNKTQEVRGEETYIEHPLIRTRPVDASRGPDASASGGLNTR